MNARQCAAEMDLLAGATGDGGIRNFSRLGTAASRPILPALCSEGESHSFTNECLESTTCWPAQGARCSTAARGARRKIRACRDHQGTRIMKHTRTVCLGLLLALVGAGTAFAARAQGAPTAASSGIAATPPAIIKPLAKCLDPTTIQRWDKLGPHRVAVTTRDDDHFALEFASDCSADRNKPSAWQMSTQAPARLCGYPEETAISSTGNMCAIASIRRLDKTQFEAFVKASGG
ncbi:DUF6491 family protein [Metallibacterium sp.]|uniref:DUF6491 family protein n=1 Tax=Metallibacterium sp. TaxID=2940281 RepID=UPI0026395E1F|nr:DUF6491 family protein [Metallibacterium sp.]